MICFRKFTDHAHETNLISLVHYIEQGAPSTTVDAGILTFVNHGCNKTYNIGEETIHTEETIQLGEDVLRVYDARSEFFNPYAERNVMSYDSNGIAAIKDIPAGGEILDNYLVFGGGFDQRDFDDNLRELKNICSGLGGTVHQYEQEE